MPVFLFDQERVLGSQHSGTNPTRRSSGHSLSVRSVNREDVNTMSPLGRPAPLPSKSPIFSGLKQSQVQVPITIWAWPFVLSQNTSEGDDWVEEEGLGKGLISNV